MKCSKCETISHKNGRDRNGNQRFKCLSEKCGITFTLSTIKKRKDENTKRLVLHLILAGCSLSCISNELKISLGKIREWKNSYLHDIQNIQPKTSLLWIETLIRIYGAIEKGKISKLNCMQKKTFH